MKPIIQWCNVLLLLIWEFHKSDLFSRSVSYHACVLCCFFSRFVLSGSLHGGSVIATYPFDDGSSYATSGLRADDALFRHLAQTLHWEPSHYEDGQSWLSWRSRQKLGRWYNSLTLKSGLVHKWNSIELWLNDMVSCLCTGGMQDYNYFRGSCFEVTFELSCCKYPPASQLFTEWTNNKEALLAYIHQVSWFECFV